MSFVGSMSTLATGTCSSRSAIASVASACTWMGSSPTPGATSRHGADRAFRIRGVEGREEVLAQQGLGVLTPRLVQQQGHHQQLDIHRCATPGPLRGGSGLSYADVVRQRHPKRPRSVVAVLVAPSAAELEPHGLSDLVRGDSPVVDELDEQTQPAAGAGRVRVVAQRRLVWTLVTHLDPDAAVGVPPAHPHGGTGVDESVGDDLTHEQHGIVNDVGAAGRGDQAAHQTASRAHAGRVGPQCLVERLWQGAQWFGSSRLLPRSIGDRKAARPWRLRAAHTLSHRPASLHRASSPPAGPAHGQGPIGPYPRLKSMEHCPGGGHGAGRGECWRPDVHLLNGLEVAAVAIDPAGPVTYCNAAAATRLGRNADALVGENGLELLFPPASAATVEEIHRRVVGGACWTGEMAVLGLDGAGRVSGASWSPVHAEGKPNGALILLEESSGDAGQARRVAKRLQRLALVTTELLTATDVEAVTEVVVFHMAEAAGATVSSLSVLVDPDTLALMGIAGGREGAASRWATYPVAPTPPPAKPSVRATQS